MNYQWNQSCWCKSALIAFTIHKKWEFVTLHDLKHSIKAELVERVRLINRRLLHLASWLAISWEMSSWGILEKSEGLSRRLPCSWNFRVFWSVPNFGKTMNSVPTAPRLDDRKRSHTHHQVRFIVSDRDWPLWLCLLSLSETFSTAPTVLYDASSSVPEYWWRFSWQMLTQAIASMQRQIDIVNNRQILTRTNILTRSKWNRELSLMSKVLQQVYLTTFSLGTIAESITSTKTRKNTVRKLWSTTRETAKSSSQYMTLHILHDCYQSDSKIKNRKSEQ
jgi:hypothetical protein